MSKKDMKGNCSSTTRPKRSFGVVDVFEKLYNSTAMFLIPGFPTFMEYMQYSANIRSSFTRVKRGLGDWIGTNWYKSVFGLMDKEQGTELFDKIDSIIKSQNEDQMKFSENQENIVKLLEIVQSECFSFKTNINQ